MKQIQKQRGKISVFALSLLVVGTLIVLGQRLPGLFSPPNKKAVLAGCTPSVKVTPQLDDVYAIEATGTIRVPDVVDIGGEAPGLVIDSGDQQYPLTFTTNPGIQSDAHSNVGKCVRITGTLKKGVGIERPDRDVIDVETLTP